MTEQNVSLIKLSILLSRFSNMAKYNLSSGRESPKKSPKPQCPKVITEKGPSAPSLPKPAQGSVTSFSVADAIEAGFLPALDKDQADMFTPSELLLYRHAQDHR